MGLAKDMVTKFGMSNEMGPLAYGENEDEVFLGRQITRQQHMSEETAKKVDSEVKKIVEKGYERARKVLTEKIQQSWRRWKQTKQRMWRRKRQRMIHLKIHQRRRGRRSGMATMIFQLGTNNWQRPIKGS